MVLTVHVTVQFFFFFFLGGGGGGGSESVIRSSYSQYLTIKTKKDKGQHTYLTKTSQLLGFKYTPINICNHDIWALHCLPPANKYSQTNTSRLLQLQQNKTPHTSSSPSTNPKAGVISIFSCCGVRGAAPAQGHSLDASIPCVIPTRSN